MMGENQTKCLNCDLELLPQSQFCGNCGQSTNQHRINFVYIWHELIHAFTHAEKGIFYTILESFRRPGIVAKEYVEGKRKKYFNPFTFLLIVIGISSLFFYKFQLIKTCNQNINPVTHWINSHYNLFIYITIPIICFFNWLFFKKSKYNYFENLVLVVYTSAIRSIFLSFVIAPIILIIHHYYPNVCNANSYVFYFYTLLSVIYFSWSTIVFHNQKTVWGFIKGIFVILTINFIVGIVIAISIYLSYQK